MSIMTCNRCGKYEDTDFFEGVFVMDKYYFCERCVQKDDLFEIVDEMQTEIDRKHVLIQRAADCAVDYIREQGASEIWYGNEDMWNSARHAHKHIKGNE